MLAERLTAQLLSGPRPTTAEEVVGHLLAVQGQDPRGLRLAVRSRSTGLTVSDVDTGLTDRRSIVVSWLNRGTLHLVRAEDYWWLHRLTTARLATGNATRLAQEGVPLKQVDRAVTVIHDEIARGPRSRDELRAALDEAGVPTGNQALVHLLVAACLRADLIRGPMRGKDHCFVNAGDWLGPAPHPLDRPEALARLARRYLAAHGPASARDLAKWAGVSLRDAKLGIAGIADEVVDRPDGLVDLAVRAAAAPPPSPTLLGPFDPVLCGWESRELVVGRHLSILTNNGLFRPFAMVRGRAVATWSLERGRITVRLLDRVSKAVRSALVKDARDVLRFMDLPESEPVFADLSEPQHVIGR